MSNNKHSFEVVELSAYTSPKIEEKTGKDWIDYGLDSFDYDEKKKYKNNYFGYLIDRSTYSPTNGTTINSIARMIVGKGLSALDRSKDIEAFARMKVLIKDRELAKIANDRKKLGMGAIQVSYKGGKLDAVTHFPMETLRATPVNDDGEIEAWAYHPDWASAKKGEETYIPAFGTTNQRQTEVYIVRPYVSGYYYYAPVDYSGALAYAVLEEEVGDFLVNDVKRGFSGTKVVNFNNGQVEDEQLRKKIANQVKSQLTGSTGDPLIVSFNENAENATTVEDIPLSDAPNHYQYLSEEAEGKILKAHQAPTWLLGANSGGNGLSSNADEIKNSMLVFDNLVIKPYQIELIHALDEILMVEDISLDLYFKTIQPLEFIDTDGMDAETKEEETGIETQMSEDRKDFDDEEGEVLINSLPEDGGLGDEWELVDKREYCEENEHIEEWANRLIKPKKSIKDKLARVIKSNPNDKSRLDKSLYKVRYSYEAKYSKGNSRPFCRQMMARTDRGVVYRIEDINQASFQGVNKSHGHKGRPYSLFKYKGGVNCGHVWAENLYRLKTKTNGEPYKDKALSSSEEVKSIPKSYDPNPRGEKESKIAPIDMPNNGHHPAYLK